MATYTIQEGDCLSVLAERFNTKVSELQRLNSDQIKNIHLIYTGNVLVIPDPLEMADNVREPIPEVDKSLLMQHQCKSIDYKHVVYFAEHPETKQQVWLGLTDEGKKQFLEEAKTCVEAIKKSDNRARLQALNKLGMLDMFKGLHHEHFLPTYKEKNDYRLALLNDKAMTILRSQGEYWVPPQFKAEQDEILAKAEADIAKVKEKPVYITSYHYDIVYDENLAKRNRQKQLAKHQQKVQKIIQQEIAKFEDKARKIALATKVKESDNRFNYAYYRQGQYYSSTKDLACSDAIKKLLAARAKLSFSPNVDKDSLKLDSIIPRCLEYVNYLRLWRNHHEKFLELSAYEQQHAGYYLARWFGRQASHDQVFAIFKAVYHLNQVGYVVLEQCLDTKSLTDQYDLIDKLNFPEQSADTIATLNAQIQYDTLGYYPARCLYFKALQEAGIRSADFKTLTGVGIYSEESYLSQLLNISLRAKVRIDALIQQAQQNNDQRQYHLYTGPKAALAEKDNGGKTTPAANKLIINELDWRPENLSNQIVSEAGANQKYITECFLDENMGTPSYVRSDFTGIQLKANCLHAKVLTPLPAAEVKASAISKQKIVKKPSLETKVGDLTLASLDLDPYSKSFAQLTGNFKLLGEALESKYEFAWHWLNGSPSLLPPGNFQVGAQAQFFRFSTGQELSATRNLHKTNGTLGGHKLNMQLDLIQASVACRLTVPEDDKGIPLEIPYIYEIAGKHYYEKANIGAFKVVVDAKLSGLVGATVNLGTSIEIGAKAIDGEQSDLGLRGSAEITTDLTEHQQQDNNSNAGDVASFSASGKVEAKAFAGVQVGGEVKFDFLWQPPQIHQHTKHKIPFKSIIASTLAGNASAGFGAGIDFQIGYRRGRFIAITDAKAAWGVGAGGKVAMEISPLVLDDFIFQLLRITKLQGFRRITFSQIGESGGIESETFIGLNTLLTAMMTFGLNAAQIGLLPFKILSKLEHEARLEKNAPLIAQHLTKKETNLHGQLHQWIEPMYPETLARLLYVLSFYHNFEWVDGVVDNAKYYSGYDNEDILAENARLNAQQRQAILNILTWISQSAIPTEQDHRQFEETMQRLTLKPEEALDKRRQWDYYVKGLLRLHDEFFYRSKNDKNLTLKELELAEKDYDKFLAHLNKLGTNVLVFTSEKPITKAIPYHQVEVADTQTIYHAIYVPDNPELRFKTQGLNRVPWTTGKAI